MSRFEDDYFQKMSFSPQAIARYVQNARRDLEIAQKDRFPEVQFTYAYQALIKAGIALLASKGGVKVRSVPGHHVKILMHLSKLLDKEDIFIIGNAMRMKRNQDLYSGGEHVSRKEAKDYTAFVAGVVERVVKIVNDA